MNKENWNKGTSSMNMYLFNRQNGIHTYLCSGRRGQKELTKLITHTKITSIPVHTLHQVNKHYNESNNWLHHSIMGKGG